MQTEHCFVHGQGTVKEVPCTNQISHSMQHAPDVIEAFRDVVMMVDIQASSHREGTLVVIHRLLVIAESIGGLSQEIECRCCGNVIWGQDLFPDRQGKQ